MDIWQWLKQQGAPGTEAPPLEIIMRPLPHYNHGLSIVKYLHYICQSYISAYRGRVCLYSKNHESRMAEILMPASAVGVSCTFAAPVGGLFRSV